MAGTSARRMLVGAVRVAALFAIIVGVSGVLAPALSRQPRFYLVAFGFAVMSFVLLNPRRRPAAAGVAESSGAAAPAPLPPPEPVYIVDEEKIAAARDEEKNRWANELAKSVESVRRIKQELASSEEARSVLSQNIEELTQTIQSVRQQMRAQQEASKQQLLHADSRIAQLNAERDEMKRIAADREAEWGEKLAKAIEGLEADQEKELELRDRKIAETQRALEQERGIREQVANLARELQQQVNHTGSAQGDVKLAMDQERAARERAEARLAELERSLTVHAKDLETERAAREQITDIASAHERELAKARQERDAIALRYRELNESFDALIDKIDSARAERDRAVERQQQQNDLLIEEREAARAEIRSLNVRLNELQDALDAERTAGYDKVAAARSELQELAAKVAGMQQGFEDERSQWSATRDDLSARLRDLQKRMESERAEWNEKLGAIVSDRDRLQHTLERERREFDAKLQQITSGMATDHENDLGRTIEEREAARAELRAAMSRVAELQQTLERGRTEFDAKLQDRERESAELRRATDRIAELEQILEHERKQFDARLQRITSGMATDHENDIGRAIEEREAARAEARSTALKVSDLQQKYAELQQTLERERNEFNEKLQKIVSGIAADHENDIGEAMSQREAARAEARHLAIRNQELQRQLDDLRASASKAVDETALRQKLDAEWSDKLQTIVTHLASDHDADIGKALEEKEQARAEARTLNQRVASLQQQLERDRQIFAKAEEKWSGMRDAMRKEIEALKTDTQAAATARMPAMSEPVAAEPEAEPFAPPVSIPTPAPFPSLFSTVQPNDIDQQQRARAEVLEIAEQAHAVLKRTPPGSIPLPREEGRTLILFVHHDPNMRTMWRDQLHKHGYDVITAADGLEGLKVASAQHPAVVIADAQMPKMDGRELCRLLKTNPQTSSAKVILMSGVYGDESSPGAETPDQVLRKPVKFDALQMALTGVLRS